MAAITKIEFWSDIGFIDGAVEIPRLNAPDPTDPDMVIEPDDPIMPSKDRFFSELKLKEYYTGLLTMSYMRITYDLKNSFGIDTSNVFYGWIDKVDLSSDGEYPMTVISWHIDEWRTWKSAIIFGSGHVKRRPFRDLESTPIQNYQRRYEKLGSADTKIIDEYVGSDGFNSHPVWWVLLSVNWTDSSDVTRTSMFTYPIFLTTSQVQCHFRVDSSNVLIAKAFYQLYGGELDEFLGDLLDVTPDSINGVWISPFCPFTDSETVISGSGASDSNPITISGSLPVSIHKTIGGRERGMFRLTDGRLTKSRTKTFAKIKSSEEERYCLTSTDGVKILDLPYDYEVDSVTTTILCELDAPYFEISFKNSTYGNLEGMTVNVPLTSLPLNSNAYASYVYSGQQEYDKQMRTVRSNSKAMEGVSVMAASGALMGAFGPMGAIAGAGMGIASGILPYVSEMGYANDKEQSLQDRLQANQPSSMILSSNSLLAIERKYCFRIKSVVPDDYSKTQITSTRAQFGISVDELMGSCDSLIRSASPTGYYNIQNMIVRGKVPVSAKKWVREKFRSGVRLI